MMYIYIYILYYIYISFIMVYLYVFRWVGQVEPMRVPPWFITGVGGAAGICEHGTLGTPHEDNLGYRTQEIEST